MKKFFLDIKNSFFSKEFYMEARQKELSSGFSFFFCFIFFISVIVAVVFLIFYIFFAVRYIEPFKEYVNDSFPEDLTIEIKDKQLSTSKGIESINFAFPDFIYSKIDDKTKIKPNLIVLAPAENTTDVKILDQYNTYFLFTQDRFFSEKSDGSVSVEKIDFKDKTIIKSDVDMFIDKLFGFYVPLSLLLATPVMFIFFTFSSFWLFITLFLVAFIFHLFMKQRDPLLTYKDVLKMGVYTLVPVMILNMVFFFLNINTLLLNALVTFAILFYVFSEKEKEESIVSQNEEIKTENKEEVKE